MSSFIALAAIIFIANSLPAFAPPTWTILVFFSLNYEMNPVPLVLVGVCAAAAGRFFLASYFRKYSKLLPKRFTNNMNYLAEHFTGNKRRFYLVMTLFLTSPISSAQLFEAAGLMKSIALRPLVLAFAVGRLFSYSFYVTSVSVLKASNVGEIILDELTSPLAIVIQIAVILGLVLLGNIDWTKRLKNKK